MIAFDPGVTTGYAIGSIEDGLMLVATGQAKWTHKQLWLSLRSAAPDTIVFEEFQFRRKARDNLILYSVEMIGVLRLYAEHYKCGLKTQTPAQAMGHFNDEKLRRSSIYKPSKYHANDAARHLLYWFVFGQGYQYNTRGFESGS